MSSITVPSDPADAAAPDAPTTAPAAMLVGGTAGHEAVLRLGGDWLLEHGAPSSEAIRRKLEALDGTRLVTFDTRRLGRWDSVLPSFLIQVAQAARARSIELDLAGLPEGAARLVRLASAVTPPAAGELAPAPGLLHRLGLAAMASGGRLVDLTAFLGEVTIAMARLARGQASLRAVDVGRAVQEAGADALPIVALVSLLVGMILAFIGGAQLAIFGAEVYVANLVTLGMAREMAAMMTAVLMAGRTGAAFAAELGTMQVNEEIDALRTLGISPIEFLVLPRILALVLMMPLLALYANAVGMLGGGIVAVSLFGIAPAKYVAQSLELIALHDFAGGLVKSLVFGVVVAMAGCYQGIRSGRDAAAVGASTTAAVVGGIVGIIVCDALLNLVFHALGI